jgi:CubicO group peptidase (beta-lactamase class C family)
MQIPRDNPRSFRQESGIHFMKPPRLAFAGLLASGLCFLSTVVRASSDPAALPRSTPEAQGIASSAVLAWVEALDQIDGMHSVMLLRHGQVVAEGWWAPYVAADNHELYSLSKSFTSTAVGFAVAEGKLSIDDEVLKFFPGVASADPSANLKAMRVRDLLTMTAGHQDESPTAADRISAQAFLATPVPHKPGTHFKYNTPGTFMLSAIVQQVTGQTVLDFLRPRLFAPLGIAHPVWGTNAQGISLGGYGLRVRTEDIARFGQFYLQKGKWRGQQLLPVSWMELASSRQVSNGSNPKSDWDQGYGFQFWRCRHGAFRGDGAFGQYCIVLPEQDAVVAITSGVKDMQAVLNVLWDTLLPAFQAGRVKSDRPSQERLLQKLHRLMLRPAEGASSSPLAEKIRGRKFVFPENPQHLEAITLTPDTDGRGATLVLRTSGAESPVACGYREWKPGRGRWGALGSAAEESAAATGAWTREDTYVIKRCFTETPYCVTSTVRFADDQVYYDSEVNVSFGPSKRPQLVGRPE